MARRRAAVTAAFRRGDGTRDLRGTGPRSSTVVRGAGRQLLVRHRHPQLPRRRHELPALGLRLPLTHRLGQGLLAEHPGLLGRHDPDVTTGQLPALSASTAYVTVPVGGNDAGFADVLTTCALPAWLSNCTGAVDRARAYIRTTLRAALDRLYASIRSRAPQARVTVVGYPRIFNGEDCNLLTWFSPTEQSRLNATADRSTRRRPRAPRPLASPSPTPPPASSGTPCATARSGFTACPTRSSSPTTRTAPVTPVLTRPPLAPTSPAPR